MVNLKVMALTGMLVGCALHLIAQNLWTVNNDPNDTQADFDNIQEAVDSAEAGDKIYVVGSATSYDSVIVTKKIHMIGPGVWFLLNGIPTPSELSAAIGGGMRLAPGSANSIIEGMLIVPPGSGDGLEIEADSVLIKGCYARNILFISQPINTFIWRCYIEYGLRWPATNARIHNSVIRCSWNFCGGSGPMIWDSNNGNVNCELRHINMGPQGDAGGYILNNVSLKNSIIDRQISFVNCDVQYNIFKADPGVDTTNIVNVNMATVVNLGSPSPDGRYLLVGDSTTNVAYGAGEFGEDCGISGGPTPYQLSLLPDIPRVTELYIPILGDTSNMLNVRLKARSN